MIHDFMERMHRSTFQARERACSGPNDRLRALEMDLFAFLNMCSNAVIIILFVYANAIDVGD